MRSWLHVLLMGIALLAMSRLAVAQSPEEEISVCQEEMQSLQAQLVAAQGAAQQDDKLKKQVELLQKQIETQQKMIELLLEHVKKQPLVGTPVEKLQTQTATLEARSKQAAQRDQDVAQAIDNLIEQRDADLRNGPQLPAPLKELFFASGTNESPLSIYGTMAFNYTHFEGRHGNFEVPEDRKSVV